MDWRRQTCLLAKTGALKDSHLELDALGFVAEVEPGMFHEGSEGDPARYRGLEAGVIDEEYRPWLRHEVNGGNKDNKERAAEDFDEIEVERPPKVQDFFRAGVNAFQIPFQSP